MKRMIPLLLALALLLTACGGAKSGAQENTISVYYLRKTAYQTDGELLTPVSLAVSADEDGVRRAVKALSETPENDKLESPLPEDVSITDASLSGGTVSVGLSDGYLDATPVEQAVLKSCLALTLCSVPGVNAASIHVGSETIEARLTADNVVLKNTVISAYKAQVRLYFPRDDGKSLGCEYRTIAVDEDNTAERRILEALLTGPEDGALTRAFPIETLVQSVYTQDGVCTVSLSGVDAGQAGKTKTQGALAAYSVADSLTALAGVRSVQILIDGGQVSSLWGFDISRPLTRGGVTVTSG